MSRVHLILVLPYIVAILAQCVAMRAGVALLPALLVARYRREERGKSFPFNGNECNVAGISARRGSGLYRCLRGGVESQIMSKLLRLLLSLSAAKASLLQLIGSLRRGEVARRAGRASQ
jgi:hypothetical protein